MFSRNGNGREQAARPKRIQTGLSFIGPEVTVSGSLATTAQVQIDGRIDGDLRCETLSMGESGVVAGDIHADEARIAGLVEGKVSARIVTIEATGRIAGDVTYETISIAAGAQIDGRFARRAALTGADDGPLLVATPIDDGGGPVSEAASGSETVRSAHGLFPGDKSRAAAG